MGSGCLVSRVEQHMAVQCLSINWLYVRTCVLRVSLCVDVRRCCVTVVCVSVCCLCVECAWCLCVCRSGKRIASILTVFLRTRLLFDLCISALHSHIPAHLLARCLAAQPAKEAEAAAQCGHQRREHEELHV